MTFLFILLDHKIGDTIVISYIFRELKKLFSNSRVDVVVDKNIEELYQAIPYVNSIWTFDRKNTFSSMLHLLCNLRVQEYDFCIGNIRNFKRKIFFKLLKYRTFLPLVTILGVHSAKHGLAILGHFANDNFDTSYNLIIPTAIRHKIQIYLSTLPIKNKKIFIFNPIGSEQNRILSEKKLKAIIALLQRYKDYAIFLLDYKKMYSITEKNVFSFTSNSILETAALISKADFVISVDTGIVHIADAFNKKIIDIFPSTFASGQPLPKDHILRWEPRGPHKNIVGNPFVDDISLEDLKRTLTELLKYE